MSTLCKGSILTLCVTDLNNLGAGVGRAEDGRVVFVRGAVSGDVVEAEIIKVNKSFLVGRLLRILSPSPHRMEGFCSAPNACGGCVYRHVTYEAELALKGEYVKNAFRKVGLPDVEVLPVKSTGRIRGYRNKGQYPIAKTKDGIRAGFYAAKSHNLIPADHCMIQNEAFSPIVRAVCTFARRKGISVYDEETGKGLLRHIYLRVGEKTGQIMLCLVVNGDSLPFSDEFCREMTEAFPRLTGILLNVNRENTNVVLGKKMIPLWGNSYMEDELCGLRFRISPDSFYQVNRDGAELLYGLAAELADLRGDEVLMDLYCGTGTIGLSMAGKARRLVGIEIVASAVECARENAERNMVTNAEFYCADAGNAEVILSAAGGVRPDVVVIDPPRKGSTRELVRVLSELGVPRVVYVSCDPDTLARDCVWFREEGYEIGAVQPVDLFPRTGHVENVVCLERRRK
jgi:23S rRNA (uracil1939-C5)-methyltransferase